MRLVVALAKLRNMVSWTWSMKTKIAAIVRLAVTLWWVLCEIVFLLLLELPACVHHLLLLSSSPALQHLNHGNEHGRNPQRHKTASYLHLDEKDGHDKDDIDDVYDYGDGNSKDWHLWRCCWSCGLSWCNQFTPAWSPWIGTSWLLLCWEDLAD